MPGLSSSRSLLAVPILALSLSGAVACGRAESEGSQSSRFGPEALVAAAPADLPALVRDRYRLQPDRRLLQALAEVHRLQTGAAPEAIKAEFQDGRWRILLGGQEMGVLSEFPSFEEGTDLLARAGKGPKLASKAPADTVALRKALTPLGGTAGSTVSDLAWLATLTVDHLEQADVLYAQAWARLALDRDPASEALLARALGYEAAAARSAAKLAKDDPIRLYALGDEPVLGALCAKRPADRRCHFLRLSLLAERKYDDRFRAALLASPFRDEKSLATLGLEARLAEFDDRVGSELADLASRQASASAPDGVAAAVQSSYRAAFYSGLLRTASLYLEQYASGPGAQQFAESLKPGDATTEELRRWIEVSAKVLDGSREMGPVAELLESARSLGAAQLFDLSVTIARHVTTVDPLRRGPIPALFERLDTRPAHLVMAVRVAESNLTSPWLFEKLARAAAEAAPHISEELPAEIAEMSEDVVRLREIADDPAMPQYAQVVALGALARQGKADDAFVRARYEALAADPDGSTIWLVDFLEKREDFAGAVAVLNAALARSGDTLTAAYLRSEMSRLQLKMGDPELAFKTIEPAIASCKEDAFLQAAAVELARKRPESALKLAQDAMQRYPGDSSETSGLIARARWQLGDYSTAAKELAATTNGILGPWNRYLPEAFADAFETAPEVAVRQAFSELKTAGIPHRILARAAIALGEKRDLEIALPLLAGLREPAPEWRDQMRLDTYDLILKKVGPDESLAWVRKAIPDRSHNFALTLYQMRRYELLLGLFANGEEGESPRIVRLVKVASLMHMGETTGPRWEGLVAAIKNDPADDFFARANRVLIDPAEGAGVLKPIADAERASIGWIMGVKAASAGRYADADGWFQVALESARHDQPPHAWSWVIESDWLHADRSLEILGKKKMFHPDAAEAVAP
jgi:tetratricopeptide (TPR) repeat protein